MNSRDGDHGYGHDRVFGFVFLSICIAVAVQSILITRSMAEGLPDCSSIKAVTVPPGAVVHQPDGDTFHIFTFDAPAVVKIRVMDAETPERGDDGFEEAKAFTREWIARGPFRVVTCGKTTFDRIVGDVFRGDERLADALKEAGHWRAAH